MSGRISKKIIALFLALTFAAVPLFSVTSSAAAEPAVNHNVPLIYIPGFIASPVVQDVTDPSSARLFNPSADEILDLVKSCLPALSKFMFTRNWDKLADEIVPLISDFFGDAVNNPDGSVVEGTGTIMTYPAPAFLTSGSTSTFYYDWRVDPIETADKLNDYINYVLECSGCSQVCLTPHSLGNCVVLAYISKYGTDKLQGVALNSSAINGERYNGEMMSGNLKIDADALTEYLKFSVDENEYKYLLDGIFDLLNGAGLVDFVALLGNDIIKNLGDRLLPEVVVPLFAGWPTIWAMIPDEYMDSAMDYVFNVVYKNDPTDRSALIEKINNYNETVRKNKIEKIKALNEVADVIVISRYGYASIPLSDGWRSMTDGVIDTKYTSFGATVSDHGDKLSADYIASKPAEYISPDGTVDASTCLFPEQTWFIKSMTHFYNPAVLNTMLEKLLYAEGSNATVNTFAEYPRFLVYDSAAGTITPDPYPAADLSAFDKLRRIFNDFIKLFKALFAKVFKK